MTNLRKKKQRGKNQKEPSRRSSAVGKILLVGGAVLAVALVYASLRSGEDVRSSPPVTPNRQIIWIDGTRLPSSSSEQARELATYIETQAAALGAPRDSAVPLTDPGSWAIIRSAQDIVERQHSLPGAWHWEEVRRAVLQVGREIPLLHAQETPDVRSLSYEIRTRTIRTYGSWLLEHSSEDAATVLVHEATHAVYEDEVIRLASYTPDEWAAMSLRCYDIFLAQSVATEGLALMNEARWATITGGRTTELTPAQREMFAAAESSHANTEQGHHWYAGQVLSYSMANYRKFGLQAARLRCGAPIILRGPRQGEYFFPSEPAPELLEPLFREVSDYYSRRHVFGLPE